MTDTAKHFPSGGRGGGPPLSLVSEVCAVFRNRSAVNLAYASMFAFVVCTIFLVLNPSSSDPFLTNVFSPSSSDGDSSSYRSRVSSILSYLFHTNNSTRRPDSSLAPNSKVPVSSNFTEGQGGSWKAFPVALSTNRTSNSSPSSLSGNSNSTETAVAVELSSVSNQSKAGSFRGNWSNAETPARNVTGSVVVAGWVAPNTGFNHSSGYEKNIDTHPKKSAGNGTDDAVDEQTRTMSKEQGATNCVPGVSGKKAVADDPLESLRNCDFFDGEWVRDESYPLYEPGSCSLIDGQFNCILNGRPDKDYQKLKWKPKGCDLPPLDGAKMFELSRGKRLAFVGDSLNRNMWESLVCILRGTVKDQSKVYMRPMVE